MRPFTPRRYGRIVIFSDSLLYRASDPERYPQYMNFINRAELCAIRGATLNRVIKNITSNEDFQYCNWRNICLVIIHVGTNDYGNGEGHLIISKLQEILTLIRNRNPNVGLMVDAILPRPVDFTFSNPQLIRINNRIKQWCSRNVGVHYYPCYSSFIYKNTIDWATGYFDRRDPTRLHLSLEGVNHLVVLIKAQIALFKRGDICN